MSRFDCGGAVTITDVAASMVIGSSRYHGYDSAKSEVEIGWTYLARAYWGGQYNGALKRLMLDHAFRFVDNVVFRVGVDNYRSQKAVEKIGGLRAEKLTDEMGNASYLFRIMKDAWIARGERNVE